ncbi:MAG: hypothetical protein COT81_03550 [Candidatus Buchananbacteria bacterium CG10_big_fil_rev_8_21_14_0_10_42_9]|uniref:Uncharacterized protein n=1 Tax=Candidatus Buchananbacteria bacterium CG10_big_fil_rev_8_21_14_0_10_42_9 TaxID=1974526 RepID=A0A2H0W127_9BACT|nr:MAG: hypothetical protein COT81_03550 [Candidatus Buchananbacteria bacterium CG10_big_fil_rev_8_21_14_0_10_42_9]
MRIILGLIIVVVGALITIKSELILRAFGRVPFAERYLGTEGGSRLFYKLLGIIVSIIGFIITFNLMTALLNATIINWFNIGLQ